MDATRIPDAAPIPTTAHSKSAPDDMANGSSYIAINPSGWSDTRQNTDIDGNRFGCPSCQTRLPTTDRAPCLRAARRRKRCPSCGRPMPPLVKMRVRALQRRPVLCALASAWAAAVSVPVLSQPVATQNSPQAIDIHAHVSEASQRFGLPGSWIYAVMRAESAGEMRAISPAGAMGLMQLMPRTWARQRVRLGLGNDPFNPRDNILAGTSYLREMYDSYGSPGFLAAYNAGPGRYKEWRDKGRPLPNETRTYVARIAPLLHSRPTSEAGPPALHLQQTISSWTHSALFPARSYHPLESPIERDRDSKNAQDVAAPTSADPVFVPVTTGKPQ